MPVPYTFATQSGNIPLSQLDANFSNVKAFADSAGTVTESAQLNITRVGTLSTLTVSGNVTASRYIGDGSALTGISAQNANAESLTGTTISSNVTQSSLTRVGTLSSLAVSGSASVSALTVSGTISAGGAVSAPSLSATTIAGSLTTAAQPNITSVGTLSALNVSGNITASRFIGNGYTLTQVNASNISGTVANATYATSAGTATTATSATTAGTVTTAAQPNITSVGTLSSLTVTGNITGGNLISGGNIATLSNIKRVIHVANTSPTGSDGAVGDIWYKTY